MAADDQQDYGALPMATPAQPASRNPSPYTCTGLGFLFIIAGVLCDGSWGAIAKVDSLVGVHPLILSSWVSVGIAGTLIFFLPWADAYGQLWTWNGFLSGLLLSFGPACLCSPAIQRLGLSQAQPISRQTLLWPLKS